MIMIAPRAMRCVLASEASPPDRCAVRQILKMMNPVVSTFVQSGSAKPAVVSGTIAAGGIGDSGVREMMKWIDWETHTAEAVSTRAAREECTILNTKLTESRDSAQCGEDGHPVVPPPQNPAAVDENEVAEEVADRDQEVSTNEGVGLVSVSLYPNCLLQERARWCENA